MGDRLVHFRCASSKHADTQSFGTLTIHDGQWAYCGSDEKAGHDWRATGGVIFERLLVAVRPPTSASAPRLARGARAGASQRS